MDDIERDEEDVDWDREQQAIMESMYPEGYDPDVDGELFDDE